MRSGLNGGHLGRGIGVGIFLSGIRCVLNALCVGHSVSIFTLIASAPRKEEEGPLGPQPTFTKDSVLGKGRLRVWISGLCLGSTPGKAPLHAVLSHTISSASATKENVDGIFTFFYFSNGH